MPHYFVMSIFSRESSSRIANVCPSQKPLKPLRIAPIGHRAYRAYGPSSQSTIKPIDHGLSVCPSITETPKPLRSALIGHRNYQPLSLLTIEPMEHQADGLSTIKPINY